jgi:hypothetical protein
VIPLRVGTGLKAKLVQALAHGCAVVTTSVGAQGLAELEPPPFIVADTAPDFALAVAGLIADPAARRELEDRAVRSAELFNPATAYRPMLAALGLDPPGDSQTDDGQTDGN